MSRSKKVVLLVLLIAIVAGCATVKRAKERPVSMAQVFNYPTKKVYFAALKAMSLQDGQIVSSSFNDGTIIFNRLDGFGISIFYYVLTIKAIGNSQTIVEARVDGSGYLGGHGVVEKKLPILFGHIKDYLEE